MKSFTSGKRFLSIPSFGEKKKPVTFWIGARRYGYTTRMTKSGENMKHGSEYQQVYLDLLMRKNEELYKKFAKELYLKRLKRFYINRDSTLTDAEVDSRLQLKFEEYSDEKIIRDIKAKCKNNDFKHLKNLKEKLISTLENNGGSDLKSEQDVDNLISVMTKDVNDNPLEQKYKLLLFYKRWSKKEWNDAFLPIVEDINAEYQKFQVGQSKEFANIKEKFKQDLLAQLSSENNIKNICYSGLDDFISISWGNPRCFILILKKIVEYAKLKGEKPLEEGSLISLETQYLGVYDTAKWFYEDAEIIGEEGKDLYRCITFLTDIFRAYRLADKPTDTSISSFNFAIDDISEKADKYIQLAEVHSLLVEIENGRKEKNSGRIEKLFQLNKTLAPLWNLPTARRGILSLDKKSLDTIFNPDYNESFNDFYKETRSKMNAPTFGKTQKRKRVKLKTSTKKDDPSLFNNKDI